MELSILKNTLTIIQLMILKMIFIILILYYNDQTIINKGFIGYINKIFKYKNIPQLFYLILKIVLNNKVFCNTAYKKFFYFNMLQYTPNHRRATPNRIDLGHYFWF